MIRALLVCALLLLPACRTSNPFSGAVPDASPPPGPAPRPMLVATGEAGVQDWCPLGVPGTTVLLAETQSSAVLTFLTTSEQAGSVQELRRRVTLLGDAINAHGGIGKDRELALLEREEGVGEDEEQGGGGYCTSGPDGRRCYEQVGATATTEETERGARLVLVPEDAADPETLQLHVDAHVEVMQRQGRCPGEMLLSPAP